MKAAIYLADGITQVVLTAESEWEKNTLAQIEGKDLKVFRGGFYACQGGWIRQEELPSAFQSMGAKRAPDSLILRIDRTTEGP